MTTAENFFEIQKSQENTVNYSSIPNFNNQALLEFSERSSIRDISRFIKL